MQGGDGTTEYEEETLVQSMTELTEMDLRRDSSWDTSRQNISQSLCVARNLDTCQYKCDSLWDTTNNGTKPFLGPIVSVAFLIYTLSFSMILLSFV